jgi:hypothetical protein
MVKSPESSKQSGAGCSASGKKYEIKVATVCKLVRSPHIAIPFNTQKPEELGGCGSDIDIKLNWLAENDIWVEAKRPTPDWMQMSLKKNSEGAWAGGEKTKIPLESKKIFEKVLGNLHLFGDKTPTFLERPVTHSEWTDILKHTPEFGNHYIECGSTTISDLYKAKKCQYIQISGKGLYHTGNDICGFGVPYFECPQQIRIRMKVHHSDGGDGYMRLSVMAAAQPVDLKKLVASPLSLDSIEMLPKSLLKI